MEIFSVYNTPVRRDEERLLLTATKNLEQGQVSLEEKRYSTLLVNRQCFVKKWKKGSECDVHFFYRVMIDYIVEFASISTIISYHIISNQARSHVDRHPKTSVLYERERLF